MWKSPAVLYHYPCPDGAFAALAAHLYFSYSSINAMFFPNTVYSPLRLEDLPLDEIDTVYLLDFVGPPGFIQQLSPKVERVIILDHHITSLENLGSGTSTSGNIDKTIDMKRSGATLAYDYFKEKLLRESRNNEENIGSFLRTKRLFEYIEDVDLWRWKFPTSKAFSSGLKDLNLEFDVKKNPTLFQQLLSLDLDSVISQGTSSLAHKRSVIDEVLKHSYEIVLGDGAFGHCLAVNADTASELRSELGNQLADKSLKMNLRGIGAVVYKVPELNNDRRVKISLRSIGSEDTTLISQKYGGGGHRNASSFMLDFSEFQTWQVPVENPL